jgi:hypothetical protein
VPMNYPWEAPAFLLLVSALTDGPSATGA